MGMEGRKIPANAPTLERLLRLTDHGSVVIYTCEATGNFPATFISENVGQHFGHQARQFTDDPDFWADHIHPDDKDRVFANLPALFESGVHLHEYRFQHKDGSYRWVRDELVLERDPDGNPKSIVGYWLDVTERRQAEERYRAMAEANPIPCAITRVSDGKMLYANDQHVRLFGTSADDMIGRTARDLYADPSAREWIVAELEKTGQVSDVELRMQNTAGEPFWVVYSARLLDYDGEPAIFGSAYDIRERKQAEDALRESERRLKDFAESAADWFWETDPEHRFTFFSDSELTIRGDLGRTRFDLRLPSDADDEKWAAHRADLDARRAFKNFAFPLTGEDGSTRYLRVSGVPVRAEDGAFLGYRGTASDITREVAAETRARKAREHLVDAMESLPAGVILFDSDDRLVAANSQYAEWFPDMSHLLVSGTPVEKLVRHWLEKGIFAEPVGNLEQAVRERMAKFHKPEGPRLQALSDGRWFQLVDRKLRDGGTVRIRVDITDLKRTQGELARHRLEELVAERTHELTHELEERARAEATLRESEERFRQVAQSAQEAIVSVDSRARITFWNASAQRIFGHDFEEALGKPFFRLSPERHRAEQIARFDKVISGDPADLIGNTVEATGLRKDGGEFPMEVSFSQWTLGGEIFYTAIIRDVTERKRIEQALITAKDDAEAANRAKSEFLSRMSHELRTPMNAILGFGQLLDSDSGHPLDAVQRPSVEHILKAGEHLLELINEVLDLVGVESGRVALSIEDVEPRSVIDDCLPMAERLAEIRDITLVDRTRGVALPAVRADFTRFKQVLLNLLSNAVKYNRPGGSVFLDAERRDGGTLRISVADTGRGIPDDRQRDIFEPFSRIKSAGEEIEGTGIGLTITRRLMELMDGRVGLQSTVGEGSVFWIDFPLAPHRDGADLAAPPGDILASETDLTVGPGARTVLYVEDNPTSLLLMERIVQRVDGLTLISTHNAELALALAEKRQPDLIMMDINLPGIDGVEAMKRLRANPKTRAIPVIALSANAMPADIKRGLSAGFRDYLIKPIKIEEVLAAIKANTGGSEAP